MMQALFCYFVLLVSITSLLNNMLCFHNRHVVKCPFRPPRSRQHWRESDLTAREAAVL